MVICHVEFGLGNQLFQYATARALALRLNTTLKLDKSFFHQTTERVYELEYYRINATGLMPHEKWAYNIWHRPRTMKILRRAGVSDLTVLRDVEKGYDERIETISGNVRLFGFWQSERYFAPVADIIRKELVLRHEPNPANRDTLDAIQGTEAVAVHVRRGDYTQADAFHVCCGVDYYQKALEKIILEVKNPHFFIFSDDPAWASENIVTGFPTTFISHNSGKRGCEDLRLMSNCRHFILANSSFSWWGAWLSQNPDKITIVPSRWYKDTTRTTADLIPAGWISV